VPLPLTGQAGSRPSADGRGSPEVAGQVPPTVRPIAPKISLKDLPPRPPIPEKERPIHEKKTVDLEGLRKALSESLQKKKE